ncbi:MAG: DUF523 and DUF1722 domain-containing protein [Deltaproteobacteria bacterium]|nr:DUF523 and DUF1722 domain-containing protein [Deltaproteobacteria bacterium]
MNTPVKIGISACLVGRKVRYDGGHKQDHFLTDTLGQYVAYVPVCPEAEAGLGIPREPMRLEGDPKAPRLVTEKTRKDLTASMLRWVRKRARDPENEGLCGFIFKARSPSCGTKGVKIFTEKNRCAKKGVGLFARAFMDHFPLIPVQDEGRLQNPRLRENFLEAVFVLRRWRASLKEQRARGSLAAFHTRHKLLIMSHSVEHYRAMGRLVAKAKDIPLKDLYDTYQGHLLAALRLKTTTKKHANVLQRMLRYFKKTLLADEKQELLAAIQYYRCGDVPLIVPITLINHYACKYNEPYLRQQYYLHPDPVELQIKNHV